MSNFSDPVSSLRSVAVNTEYLNSRGFMIGEQGAVHLVFVDGQVTLFTSGELIAGVVYPFRVRKILGGTTTVTAGKLYMGF